MSRENVELLLDWYARYWSRGDFFGSVEAWDPHVEVRLSSEYLEPIVGRGFGGLERLMRAWLGAWTNYRVFPEEHIEAGPDKIIVFQRSEGHGKGSDIPLVGRDICVYTIRRRKIVRFEVYREREKALEAAGLGE